jgi:p24 family protein beta-1
VKDPKAPRGHEILGFVLCVLSLCKSSAESLQMIEDHYTTAGCIPSAIRVILLRPNRVSPPTSPATKMITRNLAILLFAFLAKRCWSYSVNIEPKGKECFIVTASQGDTCSGSFEVISLYPEPIAVSVVGPPPENFLHFESIQKEGVDQKTDQELSEGSFQFDVEVSGDYTMCIENGNDVVETDGNDRVVAFNFRVTETDEVDYEYRGLESELAELRKGLDLLRDHQSYMSQREDYHRDAVDSINTKVLVWTILEAVILIGMAFWQISYISNFFEIKRRL